METLETEGWIRTIKLSAGSTKLARDISSAAGIGDAQAIALALQMKDRLLIDDLKGRRLAEQYKIENMTTLGVIFELFANGTITRADYFKNVKNYAAHGWISGEIIQEFIERGKEL